MDLFTVVYPDTALTTSERSRLDECESVIERGLKTFVDVGRALLEIRDSGLYREKYGTFEDYCRERWGVSKMHAYRLMDASSVVANLESNQLVTFPTNEAQARPLTQLPAEQQAEAWTRAVETAPEGKITAAHVESVVREMQAPEPAPSVPHVAHNSGNNEWYTPAEYIQAARLVMGGIDLDPASSAIANQTVGATVYYTAEDDGLRYAWDGRVWMNPPYSGDLIGRFAEKLSTHYAAGDVQEAIVLVYNATETTWFQGMMVHAAAVCFVRRRIKFIDTDGNPSGAPLQGQAILYMGENVDLFTDRFSEFGTVLYGKRAGRNS